MCIKGWQNNFVLINNVTFCCFFFLTTNKCVLSVAGKEINKAFENSISPAWFYQLTNIHSLFIKNLTFLHSKIVWCWVRINQYVRYTSYHWHMGGLHLIYLIIRELKSHMVEITAFRLERKSCKGFFFTKFFSANESTWIYNKSCDHYNQIYQMKTTMKPLDTRYNGAIKPKLVHSWIIRYHRCQ